MAGLLALFPAQASAGYGREGMPATGQCAPAYLGLDPDPSYGAAYIFTVRIVEKNRLKRWDYTYVYPTRACCEQARGPVADLALRVRDQTARVEVDGCY